MKKKIYLLLLVFFPAILIAQQSKPWEGKENYGHFNFIEFKLHSGTVLKHTESVQQLFDRNYLAYQFRIGKQSLGEKPWEKYFGYPSYGIGFFGANVNSDDTIGRPAAVYLFFNAPFVRGQRLFFGYDLGIGLSYRFSPYNPESNPNNIAIGSEENVYFNLGFILQYMLSERLDLSAGIDVMHFSNGATRTPNLGMNFFGLNLGLRYNFNPIKNYTKKIDPAYQPAVRPVFDQEPLPEFKAKNRMEFSLSGGGKTTNKQFFDGPTYFIGSITADYYRHYAYIAKVGAGFDVFYDSSWREEFQEEGKNENDEFSESKLFSTGFHIGHQLTAGRFTLVTQLGLYLNSHVDNGSYYIRAGMNFRLADEFFLKAALKTKSGAIADFIEWGVGYGINWE